MGPGQRFALIAVTVAVAAGAFALAQPGDDDDEPATQQTTAETTASGGGGDEKPSPPPKPEADEVVIANGAVRGGEQRIKVEKGDVARIDVRSDSPDEIHLHGYDVTKAVGPDKPAKFRVKADIEGVFELESHDLGHVIVAELVVEP